MDNEYSMVATDILGTSEGSGVLVNLDGQVVGVIKQSYQGESNRNIVTGLPITQLTDLLDTLSNNGELLYVGSRDRKLQKPFPRRQECLWASMWIRWRRILRLWQPGFSPAMC